MEQKEEEEEEEEKKPTTGATLTTELPPSYLIPSHICFYVFLCMCVQIYRHINYIFKFYTNQNDQYTHQWQQQSPS